MKLKKIKIKSQKKSRWYLFIKFCFVVFIPIAIFSVNISTPLHASITNGTILEDEGTGRAWSSTVGWVNFNLATDRIRITNTGLSGSAWTEEYGSFDLAPFNGGVTNDGEGVLGGHARGERLDWINFSGVTIDTEGRFHGEARGSLIGTLSFDCENCDVRTDWRPISIQEEMNEFLSEGAIFTGATTEAPMPPRTALEESPPLFDVSLTEIRSSSGNLVTRIAPGESLPISIDLRNFGGGQKVDVVVTYQILNKASQVVLTSSETVAVETTASFVRNISIPHNFAPGIYTAESSIEYLGQEVPAVSSYQFTLERKIFGLFQTDFYIYGLIIMIVGILGFVPIWFLLRAHRRRGILHDYKDISKENRIYYEMISDIITQMRLRTGDRALKVAMETKGLVVNEDTGRVLNITNSPAKVVAELILGYEEVLGKRVSFSLRPS